jgi:predicted  nucleic acid-binding Zn-ribbon protein
MATEIEDQARIDMQLKELNQKIEKASKHINERKKQEDLSSFSADELQTKVQELKRRKELLSKFKQKEQVITLIQDLHKQVSTMKKNVKSKEDKSKLNVALIDSVFLLSALKL